MRDELEPPHHPETDARPGRDDELADRSAAAGAGQPERHERVLDLAPDGAWKLLSSSEGLERWLGDRVDLDLEAGAEGTISDGDEVLFTHVESVEPGRRLSLRWWSEERPPAVVDLTLEPAGDRMTRLVVTEIPLSALEIPASPTWSTPRRAPGEGPTMLAATRALALA